jgi:anti-sigma B factor antagonist
MEITREKHNEVEIIKLSGRLDSNTTPELEKELIPIIDDGADKVIIDFDSLDYISSAGLRVMLRAAKKLKGIDGTIVLCGMKDMIHEIFEMAGFTSFFTIVANLDEAKGQF